ncbi:hypothetical protein Tco_0722628 [Tanacetum coccineum]
MIFKSKCEGLPYFEPSQFVNHPENEIHSDSNIILYSQYLLETQNVIVQDTNSFAQQDAMILSMFEQLSNQEKNAQFADFEKEINYLKQTLSEQSKEKELLTKTFNVFKNESKEKEAKNIDTEIALEKKVKELDNIAYFGKRFVPQQELTDEQALHLIIDQSAYSPVKIKAPGELPKISLVNTSLKKLKYHLDQFDNVVKKRITPNALTEGEWGFENTKVVFQNEIIPFFKTLKDIFNVFDKDLLNEATKVQTVFNQMEAVVQ